MTDTKIENIIKIINEEFKLKYPDYKGVYFFGSRARGDFNDDSDYYLMFVFDRVIDWKFKEEIRKNIYQIESIYDIFIDSKIYNYYDILNPITPFRKNVVKEGLYYEKHFFNYS